jgi:hypothetical protein
MVAVKYACLLVILRFRGGKIRPDISICFSTDVLITEVGCIKTIKTDCSRSLMSLT